MPALPRVELPVMGPKLLVSDVSTAERHVLRWLLRVKGNDAVEFGVVPVTVQVGAILVACLPFQLKEHHPRSSTHF